MWDVIFNKVKWGKLGEGASREVAMQEEEKMLESARLWGDRGDGIEDSKSLLEAQIDIFKTWS